MAFVDDYNPINFVDLPSETTPIDAVNLNKMDKQIKRLTTASNSLEEDLSDVNNSVSTMTDAYTITSADMEY